MAKAKAKKAVKKVDVAKALKKAVPETSVAERSKLAKLLKKAPLSVRKIMAAMDCGKSVVHARLAALKKLGYVFKTTKVREGLRGPLSTAYQVTGEP